MMKPKCIEATLTRTSVRDGWFHLVSNSFRLVVPLEGKGEGQNNQFNTVPNFIMCGDYLHELRNILLLRAATKDLWIKRSRSMY